MELKVEEWEIVVFVDVDIVVTVVCVVRVDSVSVDGVVRLDSVIVDSVVDDVTVCVIDIIVDVGVAVLPAEIVELDCDCGVEVATVEAGKSELVAQNNTRSNATHVELSDMKTCEVFRDNSHVNPLSLYWKATHSLPACRQS